MDEPACARPGLFAAMAGPPLVWLLVFFLAPMAVVLAYSFGRDASLTSIEVTGTLANYAHALSPLYLKILAKSLGFALVTTLACLVVGYPVAVAIAFAPARAKAWLLLAIMLPFWTNLLIRTYAVMALLRTEGLLNQALALGWRAIAGGVATFGLALPALRPLELLHTDTAVVAGLVYVQLPFMVLPLYAALDRLDRSLIEAAMDLGAGRLRAFAAVALPLSAPGIVSGVLVTLIPSVGAYLTPDLLGGPSSMMIANVIERQFRSADDWPFGAALSFVLIYLTFAAMAGQAALAARRRR
ncbi:MAG TPA: ABC transporter permease [Caulobacteraceae bacterium]|jgi:spermidine/putrescine transport system permease protein|nr:ABC transporter permease [Caulobacteraceae bacterium]